MSESLELSNSSNPSNIIVTSLLSLIFKILAHCFDCSVASYKNNGQNLLNVLYLLQQDHAVILRKATQYLLISATQPTDRLFLCIK